MNKGEIRSKVEHGCMHGCMHGYMIQTCPWDACSCMHSDMSMGMSAGVCLCLINDRITHILHTVLTILKCTSL